MVVIAVGGAVDYAQLVSARQSLQRAVDAAEQDLRACASDDGKLFFATSETGLNFIEVIYSRIAGKIAPNRLMLVS